MCLDWFWVMCLDWFWIMFIGDISRLCVWTMFADVVIGLCLCMICMLFSHQPRCHTRRKSHLYHNTRKCAAPQDVQSIILQLHVHIALSLLQREWCHRPDNFDFFDDLVSQNIHIRVGLVGHHRRHRRPLVIFF